MTVLIAAATGAVGLLAIAVYAVVRGPSIYDRFVAVAQATVVTLILLVLFGFISGRPSLYLDIALTYGLLALVVPIALSASSSRTERDRDRPAGARDTSGASDASDGRDTSDDPQRTERGGHGSGGAR